MSQVVGRFAPSPSGRMHLGNVFAALSAWLFAKKDGGVFLLRIEDLDVQRCKPAFSEALLHDLRWLGLTWDNEEILYQSRRGAIYQAALEDLQAQNLVYPCFCSRADLHESSAPHGNDGSPLYHGGCGLLDPATAQQRGLQQRHSLRLRAWDEHLSFTDGLYGPQRQNPASHMGDFILRRSDGNFAYQLAVVVDDAASGVNQVVRGRDLLPSVAAQLALQRALRLPQPSYIHLPLLLAADGKRLSKREKSLDMAALRGQYANGASLLGALAFQVGLIGYNEGLTPQELLSTLSPSQLSTADILVTGL